MDLSLERDGSALGSLFHQIISDMKNTSPIWEDFLAKAGKLHACLRAAIQAIAAYLDAFQKIADAATNSRGASKEIGTALTRVCLRHKAVETRLKTFTSAIMDCLVLPLQDKLEDWKRQVATIDKEHAKEYKRCRAELKKRSTDTLRLQKKARKGQSDAIQSLVDSHMQDVTQRRAELEDVEKKSLRAAMIEERMRYCTFVNMLQPVVKEECEVMFELGHLQEAMETIATVTKEPSVLPSASEELILDVKSSINLYPESPGNNSGSHGCSNSLGSRKSSVCSISSMNSSGSSGSPGHHHYPRSLSQLISPVIRLKPGESSDSGFCSSPALTSQASTATSQSHAVSTWPPHSQDAQTTDRPHTISSAYEKGHTRPALTVYTFQNPETIMESTTPVNSQKSPGAVVCRPPLPVRCSSLERPLSASGVRNPAPNLMQRQCPSPIPAHITKELPQHQQQQQYQQQPTYVNMSELASMAAMKITNQQSSQQQPPPAQSAPPQSPNLQHQNSTESHSSISSQLSSESSHANRPTSKTPSLHSNTSIDSERGTPTIGQTPTPSSGGSTPQNNYPPQLTHNSPSTPVQTSADASSIGSGVATNTKENSTSSSSSSTACGGPDEILKITETDNTKLNSNSITNDNNSAADKEEIAPRGSVMQKLSMFEKQAQAKTPTATPHQSLLGNKTTSNHSTPAAPENIYGTGRKDEGIYKASSELFGSDKDPDQIYEDSIQELTNLISELDSFQREHELKEKKSSSATRTFENQIPNGSSNGHATDASDSDKNSIGSGSLNYSTQSTNASDAKFAYSDSEISRYVSENSSVMGFENPTFAHLNHTEAGGELPLPLDDNDSGNIVMIYDQNFPVTPEMDYVKQNSEIVVLRCKDPQTPEPTTPISATTASDLPKQRLSSFRASERDSSNPTSPARNEAGTTHTKKSSDYALSKVNLNRKSSVVTSTPPIQHELRKTPASREFIATLDEKLRSTTLPSIATPLVLSSLTQSSPSTHVQSSSPASGSALKPTVSPRPASLSGSTMTRIARRSSVNNAKPPPPVRRSSSVTPSPNLQSTPNSPNLIQQNVMTNSTDSLPPPPAYLLTGNQAQNSLQSTIKVSETVKALAAIRHTPASPSAIRRAQNLANQQQQHQQMTATIQNQNQSMMHEGPPVVVESIYNNHTTHNHHQHQQQHTQHQKLQQQAATPPPLPPPNPVQHPVSQRQAPPQHHQPKIPTPANHASHDRNSQNHSSFRTSNSHSPGIYAQPKQLSNMSSFRSSSPSAQPHPQQQQQSSAAAHQLPPALPKTNPNLIAQLNARLNKQSDYGTYQNVYQSTGSAPNSPHHHPHHPQNQSHHNQQEQIYTRGNERHYQGRQQQQQSHDDYTSSNNSPTDKSASIRNKSKAEFLENLNAKLAKQGLSGRAFAVRNLINSKALPDPRLCHESLMDQIKRGAPLKRNQKINDRSAPKIH